MSLKYYIEIRKRNYSKYGIERGQDYTHKVPLPDTVIDAITSIYEDLSDKRLLQKCLSGFTQNNNDSFNNMI